MSARIYIEGGGDAKDLRTRCREGFSKLIKNCGFKGRMPRLIASGARNDAFDDFKTAHHGNNNNAYIALLVDSEDPVSDIEQTWAHLNTRDGWTKPAGAEDEQVLLMTTCMETWIASDRPTLRKHYGSDLQESDLPALNNIEDRDRQSIQDSLTKATRACENGYKKGKRSFEILGKLTPSELGGHLLSFQRFERVLNKKL